jgi:hypothetical protein
VRSGPGDEDRQHQHEASQPCRLGLLVEDIGRYLAGDDDADDREVHRLGRQAISRGAEQVSQLLRTAYGAEEVVATELRLVGPRRGARRTVFADEPTPVALLLLGLRLCDLGDEVELLFHTAAKGTTSRKAQWPFDMATAEELTRPPARAEVPAGLDL